MSAAFSFSLRRVSAAAAMALLALGAMHAPLLSAAQVVTADQCAYDPTASISVSGSGTSGALNNGAIFACPINSDGQLVATFQAIAPASTADNLAYVGAGKYSICPVGGGSCVVNGDLPSATGSNGLSVAIVRATLPAAGGYDITLSDTTGPRSSTAITEAYFRCRYSNNRCVAACRQCTEVVSVRCYYNDDAGLAAAKAASPTGGAGSGSGVITGAALVEGAPFAASSFGASLPLAAGQTPNPRCALNSLTFRQPYGGSAANSFAIPLPRDGRTDEVVIRDCSAISAGQVATLTAGSATPFTAATTYLSLAATQLTGSNELCKDVLSTRQGASFTQYDAAVTSYAFSGDVQVRPPVSGTGAQYVCSDGVANGPIATLPADSWRSASFAVTAAHTSIAAQCDDDSCVGGNADGACSSCSYTYRVRFACDEQPPPVASSTGPTGGAPGGGGGGGIIGDPQFVGLRGQQYQVHGVSGSVYSIVSAPALQYNARFVFLSSGACPIVDGRVQRGDCFSHAGSYLGELGLKTAGDAERIRIAAGGARIGFASVSVNERELAVGDSVLLADGAGSVSRNSTHVASVRVGAWSFEFRNSDLFVNQRVAVAGDMAALRSHGLLGQTWREQHDAHAQVRGIQGKVDDYVISTGDLFGDDFAYNAYN